MRVFSFVSTQIPKYNSLHRKQENAHDDRTVPGAQDGDDNIQYMLPVSCDETFKETCTTETTKSDYFYEKTKH